MNKRLTHKYFLSAGEVNAESELSLPTLIGKVIDISTEHANALKVGNPCMADQNAGWVLSRLTIEMSRYPKVNTSYTLTTWVESWNRHFSERSYAVIDDKGNEIGFIRSIWMVLDMNTHANAGLDQLNLPAELIDGSKCPIPRQKKHITLLTPSEAENERGKYLIANADVRKYRFGYSDLDFYRHVNTVRYISLLMNLYTLAEHDAKMVSRMELSFMHEAEYDALLEILRAPISDDGQSGWEAIELRDATDKQPLFFARIKMSER